MKITVTESMFVDHFRACGRGDQFSIPALRALFEYYEEIDREGEDEMELDPVAICCDWSEYATALEAASEMSSFDPSASEDPDEREAAALEYLRDNTTVLETGDSYVVASF